MALMVGVVLIWGLNVSVMKAAISEIEPLAFNALRFPLGVAALASLLLVRERDRWPRRDEWGDLLLLGIAAHPVYQMCFIYGLHLTSASHTAVLVATTPIWVAVADRLFGHERLPAAAWVGIVLSLAGVLVLVSARGGGDRPSWIGDGLVLLASMLWTFYVVRSRPRLRVRSGLWLTAWALFCGAPFVLLLGLPDLVRTDWSALTAKTWFGVFFAGLFALATAYWWWAAALARLGAARTAVFSNLIPVVALLIAWITLGERLPALAWLGAGLACLGVGITTVARGRAALAGRTPEPAAAGSAETTRR
jgi:drug/metabolite transporter (DMT)-like permease